jgi:hypothetical protein
MKLDGEWITRMAARVEGAEEALTGSGVFTHRSPRAVFASENVAAPTTALRTPAQYPPFRPRVALEVRSEPYSRPDA